MTRNIDQETTVSIPSGVFQRLESIASLTGESTEEITLKALELYLAENTSPSACGSKLRDFTTDELVASYQAMAADKERESEAREWCGSYLGEDLANEAK
jgi:hypothetical protein